MTSTAERLKAAQERDEEGIEQDEPSGPKFEAPDEAEEAETEESEPEPEPEPEPPPPEPEGVLDAEQAAKLEKASTTYVRAVERVFGADNVPPPCQHCGGLGFDLTGGEGPPEFATNEQYIECDDCHGLGNVLTGSKVPGHDLIACPRCVGRGYLEKLPTPQAVPDSPGEYGTPAWMGNVQPGQ